MKHFLLIGILGALTVVASSAGAQDRRVAFAIATGIAPPAGVFADRYEAGVHVAIGVESPGLSSRLGMRLEGSWDEFSLRLTGDRSDHARAGGLTGNCILTLTSTRLAGALYAIGGAGYYSTRESVLFHGTQSDIGWNFGAGLRVPVNRVALRFEGRIHDIPRAQMHFVPVTLGISF